MMGCVIGIGKILPGISGSLLAIRFGIYEKVMEAVFHFFENPRDNLYFLGKLGSGFLISIIFGSRILLHLFLQYNLFLKILFIVFIITGVPELLKKGNSWKITLLAFLFTSSIFLFPQGNLKIYPIFSYFVMGLIESFSTIIPGISGTAIFLSLGWYEEILTLFSELYLLSFGKIIPFLLGIGIGGYFILKLMNYLFDKFSRPTYSAILGFLLSSLFFVF